MALSHGSLLGAYEILSPLGAGGMGEVYRARDTRLGREVAVKVLLAERLHDEQRRTRFLREARALSTLTHPNIVTIHEIESAGGIDFIVMELVRGTSLDALIPRHGLPLRDLLRLAIPIADALAAAHKRGIIHRDLKPANVVVADDGTVKVLDFGLAKLLALDETLPLETASDLRDVEQTTEGRIAGTAGYMAPEQATGGRIDARSDVFSFGAVLYEMATGARAFEGGTTAGILAAIVSAQSQAPTAVVPGLPRELERLILRCCRKEPERRYQTMIDVRNELQEIEEGLESPSVTKVTAGRRSHRLILIGALAGMAIAGVVGWKLVSGGRQEVPPIRVVPLTALEGYEMMPTLSPDGSQVAFASTAGLESGNVDIYVAIVGSPTVHRITSGSVWNMFPRWSPDGRHIAFVRQITDHTGRVYVTSPLGGPERKVSDFEVHFDRYGGFGHLSWTPDGRHIAAARPSKQQPGDSTGIYVIPMDGGRPRALTTTTSPESDRDPAISPDGRRLAYISCGNCCWGFCDVMLVALDDRLGAAGPPRRLTSLDYQMEGLTWTLDGQSLVFGAFVSGFYTLWQVGVGSHSTPQRIEVAGFNARRPSIGSPGNRLVFGRWRDDADIYRLDVGGGRTPVGVSSAYDLWPAWSPDGRHISFCSTRSGQALEIWRAGADGSDPRPLASGCAASWHPDRQLLAFLRGEHVWTVDVEGGDLQQVTTGDSAQRSMPSWSHDGRWIFFGEGGPADANIWRIPASGGPQEQVTHDGGYTGFAAADGSSLVYQAGHDRSGLPILIRPLTGGSPQELVACAYGFAVEARGVYYYPCRPSGAPVALAADRSLDVRFIDSASGRDRLIATLPDIAYFDIFWGPRVSPDGSAIVYSKLVSQGEDLMIIENFR